MYFLNNTKLTPLSDGCQILLSPGSNNSYGSLLRNSSVSKRHTDNGKMKIPFAESDLLLPKFIQ